MRMWTYLGHGNRRKTFFKTILSRVIIPKIVAFNVGNIRQMDTLCIYVIFTKQHILAEQLCFGHKLFFLLCVSHFDDQVCFLLQYKAENSNFYPL